MGFYLAIDGGGTKTTAMVVDHQGNILGRGMAGPTSGHFVGHEAVVNHLRAAAAQAIGEAGVREAVDLIFVAAPAVYQDTAQEALGGIVPHKALHCEGDERTAFVGALGGAWGVVVLAGTGSFARGVNPGGVSLTVGGWGTLLGDEGSAYDIGVQALKAVARAADGLGPETALTKAVRERFRINRVRELTRIVYRSDFTREQAAGLAPMVSALAREGDQVALTIMTQAGAALGELAATVIRRLEMTEAAVPVVLTGGVASAGDLVLPALTEKVRAVCPEARLLERRYEPVLGAVMLALEHAGITLDDPIRARLDRGAQA